MKSTDIIGYAYDADLHCDYCTAQRFPAGVKTYKFDPFDLDIDTAGNAITPVFVGQATEDDWCGDCLINLLAGDYPAWLAGDPGHYTALTGMEVGR